ncbi:MAG: protein-disulfide reductase DsbD domain-containing protein [bacterium]
MKQLALVGLLALTAVPALAETQDDVLAAELMPGWQMGNGHYMAGLTLTLAPHWKTYWRAPGEAGIPPQFDWSGSQNVGSVALHWPSPQVIVLNGMQSIGYLDELMLPVEVTPVDPAKPVSLHLQMQLGICKDICMPASLSLSANLAASGAEDGQIAAALKLGPVSAKAAELQDIRCAVAPIADGLHITALIAIPPQGNPETVVFEVADRTVWVAEATASRDGGVLQAATDLVAQAGAPFALDRSGVTVTVIGQDHSVEIKGCPAS